MPTYNNSQGFQTLYFDNADTECFASITALGASVGIATIQSLIPFPFDIKIVRVAVAYSGTLSTTVNFNIVTGVGSAASLPVGTTDTNAPLGTAVFSVSPVLPAGNAGNVMVFFPDNPDVIYPSFNLDNRTLGTPQTTNGALSLRFITGAGGGITGITQVTIGYKPVNQHASATFDPTPAGNFSWDPSTF